jgi:hypothetical protein
VYCASTSRCSVSLLTLLFMLAMPGGIIAQHRAQQYPSGTGWAMQAMAALTGGTQVNGVTESGQVTRTLGGDQESGTITMQSTGNTNSQIQISTGAGNRSETRSWASDGSGPLGQWTGLDGQPHQMAQHNCWTDAVWFFPALSMLSDYSDPTMVFNDLGPEQRNGHNVEHIQAYRSIPGAPSGPLTSLSTVDYYLDSQTALPVAIAFFTHGDTDVNAAVPVEMVFSQYQSVSGILVPFQITRMLNGSPLFQITITSAVPSG